MADRKKRSDFQRSLASYFILNAFLWVLWWFTSGRNGHNMDVSWPAWCSLGWGIGILFQYLGAYSNKKDLAEKEYEKLKNKN